MPEHRFSVWDVVAVAVASGLTAATFLYLNTDNTEVVIKEIPVRVAPPSCVKALDAADRVVADAADLLAVANQIAPLMQDVYDAGLAEAPIAPKVREWNQGLKDAYAAAETEPDRFDLLAQQCRAERTLP